MRAIILGLILSFVPSLAHASNSERHKHLHLLHKENKIIHNWMMKSEATCSHESIFHDCYTNHLNQFRSKNKKMSPETEKTLDKLINGGKHG